MITRVNPVSRCSIAVFCLSSATHSAYYRRTAHLIVGVCESTTNFHDTSSLRPPMGQHIPHDTNGSSHWQFSFPKALDMAQWSGSIHLRHSHNPSKQGGATSTVTATTGEKQISDMNTMSWKQQYLPAHPGKHMQVLRMNKRGVWPARVF